MNVAQKFLHLLFHPHAWSPFDNDGWNDALTYVFSILTIACALHITFIQIGVVQASDTALPSSGGVLLSFLTLATTLFLILFGQTFFIMIAAALFRPTGVLDTFKSITYGETPGIVAVAFPFFPNLVISFLGLYAIYLKIRGMAYFYDVSFGRAVTIWITALVLFGATLVIISLLT